MEASTETDEGAVAVRPVPDQFLHDKLFMSELSIKADNAARTHKVRQYGFGAVNVYNEVIVELLGRIAQKESLQGILAGALAKRRTPIGDGTEILTKEAISVALGKITAAAAERMIYRFRMERPVGDSSAVVGEEVPSEQREQTSDEKVRGNDRQYAAVMARKFHSGAPHRAEVYGVADWSRRVMQGSDVRWMSETDQQLMLDILDDVSWLPETDAQREAWQLAFAGQSVADILFGMDPTTQAMPADPDTPTPDVTDWTDTPCIHERTITARRWRKGARVVNGIFRAFMPWADIQDMPDMPDLPYTEYLFGTNPTGMYKCCYYHDKMAKGLITPDVAQIGNEYIEVMGDETFTSMYPIRYPYKPLILTTRRSKRDVVDVDTCRHCAQFHPEGQRVQEAKARFMLANPGVEYVPPTLGKNCPPGQVRQWRSVSLSAILPESATPATRTALGRAMENWAKQARTFIGGYWQDMADHMVLRREVADMLADQVEQDLHLPRQVITVNLVGVDRGRTELPILDPTRPWVAIWPEEEDTGKDARRWSVMERDDGSFRMGSKGRLEAYTAEYMMTRTDMPNTPHLPGAEKWRAAVLDMLDAPILVDRFGDMVVDGVKGTFVFGRDEWVAYHQNVRMGRNLVRWLNQLATSLAAQRIHLITEMD